MTTPKRTTLIIAALIAALAALLLPAALANAQEPPEAGTRLEPGVNLVGWVGEATPVSQLFNEIPQLESVWAWDAELRDWIVAGRGAPEWLGGLGRVWAGMGLRLVLGGEEPFVWRRSTEPTRGLVKLRTGWNLVAWSGADQTPIDAALKGIGWSLRTVHRWDPITQQWSTWTSPERTAQLIAATNPNQGADDDSEMPAIRRGEALWIEVARAVNWLQPTDILPRLVFPGGASQQLQARVREDLEAVLAFYRTQYGIQADPDFTIYAAKDVDALIQAYKDDGQDVDDAYEASERALWNRASGWAGGDIVVVKQSSWPDDLSTEEIAWARYTVSHEYFHMIQGQLSDGWASVWLVSSVWLVEGTASWVDDEHAVFDGKRTRDDLRDFLSSTITHETPMLRSAESYNDLWQYSLGQLATDRLIAGGGPDFLIEFWHRLASTEIGPHGRWTSTLDWRTALQQVFSQTASEFYDAFDAWQREQAATNATTADSYEYDGSWIRGRVTDDDGAPVAGLFVNAIRVEGETGVGWNQRAETDADGSFAVQAPEDGDYRLSVDINDGCTSYYSDGQLINDGEQWDDWKEARPVKVSQSEVSGIDIRLPPNVCEWQIRGRIVGPNAEPLTGILVSVCQTGGGEQCHSSASAIDGSFAVTVAQSGEYRLFADLGHGCSVYFRPGVPTTNQNWASPITVADAHVSGILIQVPEDLCRLRVAGSLDGIERFLDGYVGVYLCRMTDNVCSSSTKAPLDDDSSFAVAIPTSGAYRLTYNLDDCSVHYGPAGVTANAAGAALINVDARDMRVAYRQVPADVCIYEISGTLVGADGQPLAGTWVTACLEKVGCATLSDDFTDGDGAFAITVPVDGAYRVRFNLDRCTAYIGQGRLTSNRADARLIRVAGRNVQLSQQQVPVGMCAYQITGSIIQADGRPLAGAHVTACLEVGGECASHVGGNTDGDGAFAITVPVDGAYHVSFDLDGCTVHFGQGRLTSNRDDAWLIRVAGRNVSLSQRQVPVDVCGYQITGRITQADGQPLADAGVGVCLEGEEICGFGAERTDHRGAFAITVPTDGRYRVYFLFDGCIIDFPSDGPTTTRSERFTVRVDGRSVRLSPRQIPAGMCEHRISGRVVDSSGAPLSGKRIGVHWLRGADGTVTDADGRFEIRVRSDGAYTFSVDLRNQPHCRHHLTGQALGSSNNPIRVSGADVTGITLRLPGTVEELCK